MPVVRVARPVAVIAAPHKSGEVLVKYRADVPETLKQQIRDGWGQTKDKNGKAEKPEKKLRGHSDTEILKLKVGSEINTALADLKNLSAVEWVEPNFVVRKSDSTVDLAYSLHGLKRARPKASAVQAPLVPNDPQFNNQWGLVNTGQAGGTASADIHAPDGWVATTGEKRTLIAVVDTGVALNHPDLAANLFTSVLENTGQSGQDDDHNGFVDDTRGWNFVANTNDVSDDQGHGTAMAGIVGAVGNNGVGISGALWKATLLPLKALDAQGTGSISDVVEAIDYAIAQKVSVILCSFGTDGYSQALLDAINRAALSGILVVTSAGNDGQNLAQNPQYPACYNVGNLLTVAATDRTDHLASFSNFGMAAHIAAPGVDILTTNQTGGYSNSTGTSAAAALAAGVAGLLKTLRPWVSAPTVRNSIIHGVRTVGWLQGQVASSGVVNAGGAITEFIGSSDDGSILAGGGGTGGSTTTGGSLDQTRATTPNAPEPRVRINSLPPSGYDDPMPTSSADFSAYYTELTKANNDTGMAGSKPMQMADPTAGTGVVVPFSLNMGSRNTNFTLPVVALGGRSGLNVSLGLTYNSNVWAKNPATNKMFYNADKGFPGPGWRLGFGAIQGINNSGAIGPYTNAVTGKNSFLYLQPDGTRRDLAYNATTQKYESYDSSYLEFDAATKVLRTTNGTRITFGVAATASGDYQFLPTEIKDRNGNFITIVYKSLSNNDTVLDYVLDTLGRRIDFYYQSNRLTEIRQDRNGTIFKFAVLDYTAVTLNASFAYGMTNDVSSTTAYLPTRITYPTGVNVRLYYTSYGQVHTLEKWVPTISGQGNERKIAQTLLNLGSVGAASYPANALFQTYANGGGDRSPAFDRRQESAEDWLSPAAYWSTNGGATYYYTYDQYSSYYGYTQQVDEPTGTKHRIGNNGLVQTSTLFYTDEEYSTITLKTIISTYTKDTGVSYDANVRPIESKITDQQNHTRKVGFSYVQQNGLWLLQNKDDYNPDQTTIYRRTTMSYTHYPTQRILGLPAITSVYVGAGTTLLAKSENIYDETGTWQDSNSQTVNYLTNAGATVQHDDTNYGVSFTSRGNLTSAKQYNNTGASNRIVGRRSYDTNGSVRNVGDAAGNRKSIDLTDNFTNKPAGLGATNAYVYLASDPIGMRVGTQYEYYTGHPVQSFALRPNQTTPEMVSAMTYDFADRPLTTTAPNGATATMGYWDNLLRTTTLTNTDASQFAYSFQDTDGAGQVRRKGSDHPNAVTGQYSGQQFKYDQLGRQYQASNVMAVDSNFAILTAEEGSWAQWQFGYVTYDQMSRATQIQKPDASSVFTDYSVCGCAGGQVTTFTDEDGHKQAQESDFLGRLKYAREMYSTAVQAEVEYFYDELDRLTTIKHRGISGTNSYPLNGASQDRSFAYDQWGRSLSETTPEAGTVSYSYTTNDQIQTTTSARGIVTTVAYNSRNLVKDITYSDGTPAVSYGYDDYGARNAMTDGEGTMSYAYNSYRQLEAETRTFTALPNQTYTYNYSYGLAGQLKQANYVAPNFNKNVNYAYNATGALTGIGTNLIGTNATTTTNVISSLTYLGFGRAKTVNYGNNRKLTLSYDGLTQRLSNQKLTLSNDTDPIMDYSYGYQPKGLINNIQDNLDSTYSVGYQYNFRHQLSSANYNYNNAVARTYSFDDFGNLKTEGDYYSGQTLKQYNYAVQSGNNVPTTNRLSSLVSGGVTTNFSYDASGNMTNAGAMTYAWDGANRLKNVNGGTLGSYGYDGNGKRVKKTEGGADTYYVYSSVIGRAVMEVNSSSVQRAYVMGAGGVIAQRNPDGNFYWLHQDHLKNGRKMTDTSGNLKYRAEFDPYGKLLYEWTAAVNLNTKKFTGYERDAATGLDYAQARMYTSEWGRFMSPDPAGLSSANKQSPKSFNRYNYTEGNPSNHRDPTGKNMRDASGDCMNFYDSEFGYWSPFDCYDGDGDGDGTGTGLIGSNVGDTGASLSVQDNEAAYFAETQLLSALKNPSATCTDNVIKPLQALGLDVSKFIDYLSKGITIYNGTETTWLASGGAYKPAYAPDELSKWGLSANATIADLFKATKVVDGQTQMLAGITSPTSATLLIFARNGRFTGPDSTAANNAGFLFHEGLHGFGSAIAGPDSNSALHDEAIMSALQKVDKNINPNGASSQITNHIAKNCF